MYLVAAIHTDTPLHVVERVITPLPCSAISPQRLLSPQYNSCSTVDHDDDYSTGDADNVDDILSQSSMSLGPPSPHSDISLQGSLNALRDSNTNSSVDGRYDDSDITFSQSSMSPDPPSPKSSDLASPKSHDLSTHGPSCPTPSPYDSNADSCDGNVSEVTRCHSGL